MQHNRISSSCFFFRHSLISELEYSTWSKIYSYMCWSLVNFLLDSISHYFRQYRIALNVVDTLETEFNTEYVKIYIFYYLYSKFYCLMYSHLTFLSRYRVTDFEFVFKLSFGKRKCVFLLKELMSVKVSIYLRSLFRDGRNRTPYS